MPVEIHLPLRYTVPMTLYSFVPQDRSGKIRWLLEELGVPFEIKKLDGKNREHKREEYLALNPIGVVPTLQDGDVTLFESGAIALYLTEKTGKLAPSPGSPKRGDFLKWLFCATATLDPMLIKAFRTEGMSEEEKKKHIEGIREQFKSPAAHLAHILAKSTYVLGEEFSAADVMLGQPLYWARRTGLLEDQPVLAAYLKRLEQRPACVKSGVFPAH